MTGQKEDEITGEITHFKAVQYIEYNCLINNLYPHSNEIPVSVIAAAGRNIYANVVSLFM